MDVGGVTVKSILLVMKKPDNWNSLIDSFNDCTCPYAYIVGYYLSRFDRDAYQKLGFGNMTETHETIGSILEISSNTIKNFRDAFDPYHKNSRKGWWQRELWHFEKEIYQGFQAYSEKELYDLVCKILTNPKLNSEEIFDFHDVADDILIFPDEVGKIEAKRIFKEGSVSQITVNSYERNNQARKKCIEYYGKNCYICRFDFEKVFGEIGKGFIHVHHLISLSEIHQEYEVDPIQDLRPVCPNCHAMIHRKNPPFTIEEIKNLLNLNN